MDALSPGGPGLAMAPDGFDLVVSGVNAQGAGSAAIWLARERGCVYCFSMATQFSKAALGAEGLARDVDLMIGNGYCVDHARDTLALYRRTPALSAEPERRYM